MSEFLLPQVEEWRNRAEKAEAEVKRLQQQLAEQDARGLRLAGELEHAEAEVKRLGEWKARRQAGQESIDISLLRAEVGRLQEELAGWMNEDTHEVHALRGKVERLQEDLRLQKAEQVEWAADNERLQAENGDLRNEEVRLSYEVERLQARIKELESGR